MSKVSTPYTSYDELMLDLDIFGTLVSQSQPDLTEFKEFLYEEYKRVHKVTLESRRYELSDVVSADFHVNYVKDIELFEDEEELSWGTDSEEIANAESEDEEYDDSIYDVPTQEEIQALKDEIVALTSEQQASAESMYGSVEVGSAENSGMIDMSYDSDLPNDEEGIASFSEEENYDAVLPEDEEDAASFSEKEDSSGSGFVFADELTDEELNVEIDDEDEEDDEEFGVGDDEDFLSTSDSGVESEELDGSDPDGFELYEDFDEEDEEEFGVDFEANEDDESQAEESSSPTEEESSEDLEDSEDDEDFDDWDNTDESPTQEEIPEQEIASTSEDDEDWEQEPEIPTVEPAPVAEIEKPARVSERSKQIQEARVSRNAADIARRRKSEQARRNKIEKERQAASIPKSVPPVPIMPPRQEKKAEAEPKINREDEPKDLREFLRKHPHSEVSFVLKYFSKKELQKAIMSGRVIKKGSKLHI